VKKLNETNKVLLTIDVWSNRQMRGYLGITVYFISNEKLYSAMLRLQTIQRPSHSWQHRNPHFVGNDSHFEIMEAYTSKRFSAFLDECSSLVDVVYLIKDLKRW